MYDLFSTSIYITHIWFSVMYFYLTESTIMLLSNYAVEVSKTMQELGWSLSSLSISCFYCSNYVSGGLAWW